MRLITHFVPVSPPLRGWIKLYYYTKDHESGKYYRLYSEEEISKENVQRLVYRQSLVPVEVTPVIHPGEALWLTCDLEFKIASAENPQKDPNQRRIRV